ncbi:hypothetical protein [Corallococcus sicarius]|uniref:Uncharacterized protein n=1 Tax=Corallococcus sicarius TaxID=2316726 RepID=A0A3A8NE55_9BACT|nr:hypothetical protein [Corallococcus sicarius]RKH40491.1 hypothetical protein D7X12_20635 [Corallococcus sicarius]
MKPPEVTRPGALPRGVRFAAALCLVLSTLTGMLSCSEASVMMNFEQHREAQRERPTTLSLLGKDPAVTQAIMEAQLSALSPMRESRALVLCGLTVACTLLFFASSRMLRSPEGIHRDGFRQLLGGAGIFAALLRTIDGAQWTVVARHTSQAMVEGLKGLPEFQDPLAADQLRALVPSLMTVSAVLPTVLVAGAFAMLAQYFRSERVREVIVTLDGPTEDP